jgi:uncharacterized protein (DUF1800 family)
MPPPIPNNPPAVDPQWAWQAYQPTAQSPWDIRKAGHLFRRAAFGATHAELQQAVTAGPQQTITQLVQGRSGQQAFEEQSGALLEGIRSGNNGPLATAWWLHRMLYSPHPLREKLTLFWHNHFATSNLKVNNASYMLGQYQLMREFAQGNFRTLLERMGEDPAMMVWLDTVQSQRDQPNENYARELMELFSLGLVNFQNLGQPNYTEQDIREAAKAFTGYRIQNGRSVFNPNLHNDGQKTVLGQTGNWRGPDIARICLEQPACPLFIAKRMFKFLISDTLQPTTALLTPLANQFRQNNWNFGAMVERMLRSNLFFSQHAYRNRIKSPVEFAIGLARALEAQIGTTAIATTLEGLGQRLFYPPSVAGWEGGQAWLNGQTLLFRHNLALALTSTEDVRYGDRADPARLVRTHQRQTDAEVVDFFLRLFLQGDVPAASRTRLLDYMQQARNHPIPVYWTAQDAADQRVRAVCHLVLCLPEYQLA